MIHGFKKLMIVLFIMMLYAFSMVFFYYQKEQLSKLQNKQVELTVEIKKQQKKLAEESNQLKIYARALLLKFRDSSQDEIIIIDDE